MGNCCKGDDRSSDALEIPQPETKVKKNEELAPPTSASYTPRSGTELAAPEAVVTSNNSPPAVPTVPAATNATAPSNTPVAFPVSGASRPLVVLVRQLVQPDKLDSFTQWATQFAADIEQAESTTLLGVLHQKEGGDPLEFFRLEIHLNEEAITPQKDALAKASKLVDGKMTAEVWGEVTAEGMSFYDKLGIQTKSYVEKGGFAGKFAPRALTDQGKSTGPASTPLVVVTRARVMENKVEAFMGWAAQVNKAVEMTEKGTLHFMMSQEVRGDPLEFSWLEIYQDDAALLAHLANPEVEESIGKMCMFLESSETEIWGEMSNDTRKYCDDSGMLIHYYTRKAGFSDMFTSRYIPKSKK